MEKICTLSNREVSIAVSTKGAELQSLYSHRTQTEYLWQPGEDIWPHHSILLFPNPGRIANDRTVIGGKVYPATMHGFAKDLEFTVVEESDKLVLELTDNAYTRKFYPYSFRLVVEFALEGDTVCQTFRVENRGGEPLWYCLGAHPGFYCPIGLSEKAEDYCLLFDRPQQLEQMELQENTRLLTGKATPYRTGEREIPLGDHFFDNGPMIFRGMDADTVTLCSDKSGRFLEFGIRGFTDLCLWGVPTRMSIIAVEPWIGTSDRVDTDHVWEHKPGARCVLPGEGDSHTVTFRMG